MTEFRKLQTYYSRNWHGKNINGYLGLLYLMKKHKNDCIVLLPRPNLIDIWKPKNNWQLEFKYSPRTGRYKVNVPKDWKAVFDLCMNNPNIRFVIMKTSGIKMVRNEPTSAHANMFILDKNAMKVENFDPYGYKYKHKALWKKYDEEFGKFFSNLGLEYVKTEDFCPLIGLQEKEGGKHLTKKDTSGYCMAWSIFFTDIRLANPDIDSKQLLLMVMNDLKTSTEFKFFIRNYSQFLLTYVDIFYGKGEQYIQDYINRKLKKYSGK